VSIEYRPQSLLPVFGLAGACLLAGVMCAGAVVGHFSDVRIAEMAARLTANQTRVGMLEAVLRRQADAGSTLVGALSPPPASQDEPPRVNEPSKALKRERADPAAKLGSLPSSATAQRPQGAKGGEPGKVAGRPNGLPQPVSPEALAAARAQNKIEGIDAAKLGVDRIEAGAVVMRSGGRVQLGGRFPSGERLLFVDPANAQIITDARTILVF